MQAAGSASGDKVYVEDVFSTHLYTGTGSTTQSINNGMDLSGTGGLVWAKPRSTSGSNSLYDTERGVQKALISNATGGNQDDSGGGGTAGLYQFNSNGYKINDEEWENKAVRLVAAWNTDPSDVDSFLNIIKS